MAGIDEHDEDDTLLVLLDPEEIAELVEASRSAAVVLRVAADLLNDQQVLVSTAERLERTAAAVAAPLQEFQQLCAEQEG